MREYALLEHSAILAYFPLPCASLQGVRYNMYQLKVEHVREGAAEGRFLQSLLV